MATFAIIENNIVTNTILADTLEDAQLITNSTCVEFTETNPAGIGWTYDGTSFIELIDPNFVSEAMDLTNLPTPGEPTILPRENDMTAENN